MRVAGLQLDLTWEDRTSNFARVDRWLEAAVAADARLVVLPEMFPCGFTMNTTAVAEPFDGPSAEFLASRAQRHDLWLAGSAPERADGADADARPANVFLVAAPDGTLRRYAKIHPFTYADEHSHYRPGDRRVVIDIDGLRCGLFVCYDLRFANHFWELAEQADAYLVVASWPEPRRRHWTTLLTARAIENQAYVVGINRVGEGGGLRYTGDSLILDPMGSTLAAGAEQETMLLADLDPGEAARVRRELPFQPDRRTDVR
ncbi:MAG: nitrilase-related carbon-nitrogen hydrolase [Acidobacteriota bacterium]